MINVYQPSLGEEELSRIREVFESNWLGKGKLTDEFEDKFAHYIGSEKNRVCSTNCCTEGLFSSMYLFDIHQGDEVIAPAISFIAAGNAVLANGSKLVICDVDSRTQNARAEDIEKKITKNTKALILLHFGGVPCEMDEIMNLAKMKNIKVIEDSACCLYSKYKGRFCGTIGDMGMWSFDAMKILVCGDGSILHFSDPEIREKAVKWLYHGLESKSGFTNTVDAKWWEFDISCFGHRSIMNDVTAAMALEQLKKLPLFFVNRKGVHELYNELLRDVTWLDTPPLLPEYATTSYYFYHIQLKSGERDDLARFLRENGIYTTYRYYPLHRVKKYTITGSFPNADYAADHTLCLPLHQSLSKEDVNYIADKIKEYGQIKRL